MNEAAFVASDKTAHESMMLASSNYYALLSMGRRLWAGHYSDYLVRQSTGVTSEEIYGGQQRIYTTYPAYQAIVAKRDKDYKPDIVAGRAMGLSAKEVMHYMPLYHFQDGSLLHPYSPFEGDAPADLDETWNHGEMSGHYLTERRLGHRQIGEQGFIKYLYFDNAPEYFYGPTMHEYVLAEAPHDPNIEPSMLDFMHEFPEREASRIGRLDGHLMGQLAKWRMANSTVKTKDVEAIKRYSLAISMRFGLLLPAIHTEEHTYTTGVIDSPREWLNHPVQPTLYSKIFNRPYNLATARKQFNKALHGQNEFMRMGPNASSGTPFDRTPYMHTEVNINRDILIEGRDPYYPTDPELFVIGRDGHLIQDTPPGKSSGDSGSRLLSSDSDTQEEIRVYDPFDASAKLWC